MGDPASDARGWVRFVWRALRSEGSNPLLPCGNAVFQAGWVGSVGFVSLTVHEGILRLAPGCRARRPVPARPLSRPQYEVETGPEPLKPLTTNLRPHRPGRELGEATARGKTLS